jgi:hypothetical protein
MVFKEREKIKCEAKKTKYRALYDTDRDRFDAKLESRIAYRSYWGSIVKVVDRYDRFRDDEDYVHGMVHKEFSHHCVKCSLMMAVKEETS